MQKWLVATTHLQCISLYQPMVLLKPDTSELLASSTIATSMCQMFEKGIENYTLSPSFASQVYVFTIHFDTIALKNSRKSLD